MDIKSEIKNQRVLFVSIFISSCILFKYMSVKSILGYNLLTSHPMIFGINTNEHVLSLCLALMGTSFCVLIKCLLIVLGRLIRKMFK